MTKIIFYLTVFILLCMSKIHAQDPIHKDEKGKKTFESEVKSISSKIENITKEEKSDLKIEVEAVNVELENGKITKEEAETKKQKLAETRAKNIEIRVAIEQQKLQDIVQQKVDGKIKVADSTHQSYAFYFPAMKVKNKNDKTEKRTTSQFVFAFGANNLVTNKAVANSDFRYWQSHFYEWGFTENTRIFKNHNLLHLKYGFSVMYNNLRPTDNRFFESKGAQTILQTNNNDPAVNSVYINEAHFKNVYLVAPLHLEFDFSGNKSKNGNSGFSTHKGTRLGLGGYIGSRIKSKQKLYYKSGENDNITKMKGNFNANDFIYGVSTYLGYKETSLYLKYDLNPLFKNNAVDQNNISLGVRFDFN